LWYIYSSFIFSQNSFGFIDLDRENTNFRLHLSVLIKLLI
jgi:hypothetical protein